MKKMIPLLAFCLPVFALVLSSKTYAQSLSSEDIKTIIVKDWERAKTYTLDYLNAMPADKYSFKAVDSIRSFAQQMLHLAMGNISLISNASGQPRPFGGENLEKSPTAQTKASVVYYVTKSYDYAIDGAKNI